MSTLDKPALKQLQCPNCGAALSQFNPGAQTIVCPTCGSYVAVGAGDPEVTGKTRKLPSPPKPIELGKTITVQGTSYMVLGRVAYMGWDDEDRWRWDEWLVGADDGRMLWLAYDEKGFSIFKKERFREPFNAQSDRSITLKGKTLYVKERYPARIVGAEGELTWRAKENERLYVAEGAQGGLRFSVQQTDEEIEVYTGRGVSELDIAKSFNDEKWIKQVQARKQRGENMRFAAGLCILFAIAALSAALMTSAIGERVQQITVPLRESAEYVPLEFNRAERPAVVDMRLMGSIPENNYVDVDVSMIAPDETETYLFTKSFWHETGYDEDGFWRETDYNNTGMFVPLQEGAHRLMIRVDEQTFQGGMEAEVTVRRNIWVAQWFIGYAVVIGGVGVLLYMAAPTTK